MNLEKLSTAKTRKFVRTVDKKAPRGRVSFETSDTLESFVQVFGPPERRVKESSLTLSWHFMREDGVFGFSIWAEMSSDHHREAKIKVTGYAVNKRVEFYLWATDRLSSVLSGDEQPMFICATDSIVCPVA